MNKLQYIFITYLLFISINVFAEGKGEDEFSDNVLINFTPIKSQGKTGTCWSFATTSFLESELLRMGKGEFDLSEMYFVGETYKNKAVKFFLYHGNNNFSQGGQAHDVMNVVKVKGIVPDKIFPGKKIDDDFQHKELITKLNEVINKSKKWSKNFDTSDTENLNPILKKHLGKLDNEFKYNGKIYTAKSFREFLGIDPSNYIELTSYNHHPFYKPFVLEIPDNWSHDFYYNLPIDELMEVTTHSLSKGYTICWDGDTSERTFTHKKGKADLPKKLIGKVDQELRQKTFYNRTTTDDHLMHIVGIATSNNGRTYFNTKNSWGETSNDNGGLLYMSEDYLRLKTVAILVHRDAIPEKIRKKLGL